MLRVLVVVDFVNDLIDDQFVEFALLAGLLTELLVVLPRQVPKIPDPLLRGLLERGILGLPILLDVHLDFRLDRLVFLRGAESEELRDLAEEVGLLLLLDELAMELVLDDLHFLGLPFYGRALSRVLFGLPYDLIAILFGNLELHHLLDLLHLLGTAFFRGLTALRACVWLITACSASPNTRVTSLL